MNRTFLVVPTIRKECLMAFLAAWNTSKLSGVIIVEDNPKKTFDLHGPENLKHYSWEDIDEEFGDNAAIFPRRTDCIRSYGYYKAYQAGADIIVTLDDDCFPVGGSNEFFETHLSNLKNIKAHRWMQTGAFATRGYPFELENRSSYMPVALSHGLWRSVLDWDAVTALNFVRKEETPPSSMEAKGSIIPIRTYFPMCGMNLAWKRELTPAMYFLLMGKSHPYDRFGDIWCGIMVKKICDHLGYLVHNGGPEVLHQRASNVWANLRKEAPGMEINEDLWCKIDQVQLTETTVARCYAEIADKVDFEDSEYFNKLRQAMKFWAGLFLEG